jgi:hypothetical protein
LKATTLKNIFFFLLSTQIYAQDCPVENYNKANYQGDNQTWNVAQGSDDVFC